MRMIRDVGVGAGSVCVDFGFGRGWDGGGKFGEDGGYCDISRLREEFGMGLGAWESAGIVEMSLLRGLACGSVLCERGL